MTITTGPRSFRGMGRSRRSGFTLTEILFAMSLALLIGSAVFSSFIFMGRSTLGIANYSIMNTQGRIGLEEFGRDVRTAIGVKNDFNETSFTLLLIDPEEPDEEPEEITYEYRSDNLAKPLVRINEDDEETVIMTGVEDLKFQYYNLQGNDANNQLEARQIQLSLTLVRENLVLENTEKVVSARFIMRNMKGTN